MFNLFKKLQEYTLQAIKQCFKGIINQDIISRCWQMYQLRQYCRAFFCRWFWTYSVLSKKCSKNNFSFLHFLSVGWLNTHICWLLSLNLRMQSQYKETQDIKTLFTLCNTLIHCFYLWLWILLSFCCRAWPCFTNWKNKGNFWREKFVEDFLVSFSFHFNWCYANFQ